MMGGYISKGFFSPPEIQLSVTKMMEDQNFCCSMFYIKICPILLLLSHASKQLKLPDGFSCFFFAIYETREFIILLVSDSLAKKERIIYRYKRQRQKITFRTVPDGVFLSCQQSFAAVCVCSAVMSSIALDLTCCCVAFHGQLQLDAHL